MKLTQVILIGVLLITALFSLVSCGLVYGSTQPKTELQIPEEGYEQNPGGASHPSTNNPNKVLSNREAEIAKIRNATLLIRMQAPKTQNVVGVDLIIGFGMGSLIRRHDEILLVTHNHWGKLLQDVSIIEFRNADDQLIIPILGYEFMEWVISQDPGTLVLRLPKEFIDYIDPSAPISMDAIPLIAAGENVDVVYRQGSTQEKVSIFQAVVEEIVIHKGFPAIQLRSLDGQPIKQGDSGGGIWYKGALVGNNWFTMIEKSEGVAETSGDSNDENFSYTGMSIAAILVNDFAGRKDG